MPLWTNTTPVVVNHTGALDGQPAPPNSLEAVAASLAAGAAVVEVDINLLYLRNTLIAQSLTDGFNWAECCRAHNVQLDAWTMDATNSRAVECLPMLQRAGVDLLTTNTPRALARLLGVG